MTNPQEQLQSGQEIMFKASFIEKHLQELSEKFEYISQQLSELEGFSNDLKSMKTLKDKEIFASLGRGIYAKAFCKEKDLFINAGSGVIVKKTPEEALGIINSQMKSFYEAKTNLAMQLEAYKRLMSETLAELEKAKRK